MKALFYRLFINSWQRKLIALIFAMITWFLVNDTITVTRSLPNIPVRIINLPPDKTVVGLLPNGFLKYRITVTVSGRKSVIHDLRPSDLEVVIDADGHRESWIVTIDKKDLINVNGDREWKKSLRSVTANDLYIKVSRLITEEISVTINQPIGDPPPGYQFLDIWPKYLTQKVSGPQEQIHALKEHGLDVTFNLNRITKEELDALDIKTDEVAFFIPDSWKTVSLPFKGNAQESFNDPRAKLLRIDFLKQELIPIGVVLPITIFFSVKNSLTINPNTYSLQNSEIVEEKNGLKLLTIPLYVRDVSRLFLDVVKDNLLLVITLTPSSLDDPLKWAIEFIDENALENAYVAASFKEIRGIHKENEPFSTYNDQVIRYRFRDYLRQLRVYTKEGTPLQLTARLQGDRITLDQKK